MTSSEWYRFITFTNKSGCVKSEDFMKYLDYFAQQNPNDSEVDSIETVKENLAKAYKSITKRDFYGDYPNVWNYSPTTSGQHTKIETNMEVQPKIGTKKTVIAWPKAGKIEPENENIIKSEIHENDPQPGCSSSTNEEVPFVTVVKLGMYVFLYIYIILHSFLTKINYFVYIFRMRRQNKFANEG